MHSGFKGRQLTLVGAGPVGSLLAIYLARLGFSVDVYERRPDMRRERISAGRSINMALSTRGLFALKEVGLEHEILSQAVPMRGRMMHARTGELTFQPYGKDDSEYINSISRGGLNKLLMTAAESAGVSIHFNKKADAFDFARDRLVLEDEKTGDVNEIEPDVVIGTDGSASAIRHSLMQLPGYACSGMPLDYGYKELSISPGPGGSFRMEKNALHIWPRGTYMLIALPNYDGSYTCTLFLPFHGNPSFEYLSTPERVEQFFNEQFPDVVPLIDDLVDTFFTNPTGHMVTVKCRPWHADGRVLLLGDAAHAIVPFFGQGMNCGFEDCTVLNQILLRYGDTEVRWNDVFDEFYGRRADNTDAIADMAVDNFIEMRDKVADPRFLMAKSVEKILEREFPGEYVSRYALVTFSRVPYRLASDAGAVCDSILSELCRDLTHHEDVDLQLAGKLIRARLKPVLKGYEKELCR